MPDPSIDSIEFYNAALDAIQAGRFTEALAAAENALTENPSDRETWQLYVIILNALGRSEDARKATEKLKEFGMDEADGLLLQAAEATSSGDLPAALGYYESAVAVAPGRAEIHAGYALALLENSRPEEALTAVETATRLAPDDPRSNYVHGHILRLAGKRKAALAALTNALAFEPDLMIALYEQGMLLAEEARFEEALANFNRFLEAHPGDPNAKQAIQSIRSQMRPETR
jgi:tetratricopeptide (TPR) repeat protein